MRKPELQNWIPVGLLGVGCALLLLARQQEVVPLVAPLDTTVPATLLDLPSRDQEISPEEQRIAGMSNYVLRMFGTDSIAYQFSVYVGYYEGQIQGSSIHSPKNCLPGAGWEPISSSVRPVQVGGTTHQVNRYLLGNQNARVVVYYWYQGRGRVAWNEFAVKWELMRDKAVHGRSEESLVRIVVPVLDTEEAADATAQAVAEQIIEPVFRAMPPAPGTPASAP